MTTLTKIRCVVTGHTPAGTSILASESEVDAITFAQWPGMQSFRLWGADHALTFPDAGNAHPVDLGEFPPVGGFRFGVFTVPPDAVANTSAQNAQDDALSRLLDSSGMHTTDTIDCAYIISGDIWLELDDGKQVHLQPGDTLVQNGTRHAWRNKSSEPCRFVYCQLGAHRHQGRASDVNKDETQRALARWMAERGFADNPGAMPPPPQAPATDEMDALEKRYRYADSHSGPSSGRSGLN